MSKTVLRHFGMISALVLALLLVGCPIRWLSGVPCPGCGLTRAWWSALHLDVHTAFRLHPLWLPAPFFLLFVIHLRVLPPRFQTRRIKGILIGIAAAYAALYLYRVFAAHDPLSQPNFSASFLSQFIDKIRSVLYT